MEAIQLARKSGFHFEDSVFSNHLKFTGINHEPQIAESCLLPTNPLAKKTIKCLVAPQSATKVSNQNNKVKSVFINGALNRFKDGEKNAQVLADNLGRDVIFVYNDREKSLVKELVIAIASKVSRKWGAKLEPSVGELSQTFDQIINSNKKVDIHAHSQGAVLLESAVKEWLDKKNISEKFEREKILSKHFKFTIYGAPEASSSLLQADFRKFSFDPIPLVASPIDKTISFFKKTAMGAVDFFKKRLPFDFGDKSLQRDNESTVSGVRHGFKKYVKATHKFFINDPLHKGPFKLSSTLQHSIANGEYSDSVYDKIINLSLEKGYLKNDQERELFRHQLLNFEAEGKLGNYRLPGAVYFETP